MIEDDDDDKRNNKYQLWYKFRAPKSQETKLKSLDFGNLTHMNDICTTSCHSTYEFSPAFNPRITSGGGT